MHTTGRVSLPLIAAPDAQPKIDVTNGDVEAIFEAEDIAREGSDRFTENTRGVLAPVLGRLR